MTNLKRLRTVLGEGTAVFATLHDYQILTGGCHNPGNCQEFARNCQVCPSANLVGRHMIRTQVDSNQQQLAELEIKLVAPSLHVAERLSEIGLRAHSIIDNPLNEVFLRDYSNIEGGENEGTIDFLFVSRQLNDPIKNLNEALEIFRGIRDKHPHSRLTLVGKGHVRPEVGVLKIGEKSEAELAELMHKSHYLIMTSLDETFSLVCSEAAAQNCTPISLRRFPSSNHVLRDGGKVYDNKDDLIGDIANHAGTKNPILETDVSAIRERYRPDFVAQKYVTMYEKSIAHGA